MSKYFIIGPKSSNFSKIVYDYDIISSDNATGNAPGNVAGVLGKFESSISIYTQLPASKLFSVAHLSKINVLDESDSSNISSLKSKTREVDKLSNKNLDKINDKNIDKNHDKNNNKNNDKNKIKELNNILLVNLINEETNIPYLKSTIQDFSLLKYSKDFNVKTIINYKRGIYYKGEFDSIDKMRSGFGILYSIDQKFIDYKFRYIGYFKLNLFHGIGILEKEDGWIYKGEFRDNISNGYGIEISELGKYEGFWLNGSYHGYGQFTFSNKLNGNNVKISEYKGCYFEGARHGIGLVNFEDGSRYFGGFRNNKMNGVGLFEWKQGHKYYGTWKNDKMHGKGKYVFKNGDMYVGEYENDLRHGNGEYIFVKIKSVLKGQWVKGKKEGKFTLTQNNKTFTINYKDDINEL